MLVASRYNTFTPSARPDTFLAFNVFTGALLELDERDYASVSALDGRPGAPAPDMLPPALRQRLAAAGVLVPASFDERAALFDIRRRSLDAPDTLLLTLAPTIQCNFRCTYCFESHRQEAMTPAIEADLMRFIARKAEGTRAITTTWFGGEPLLRPDVVERVQRFTNSLGEARGLSVSRGIVTNGYFLSEEMVRRLQALGDWKMVQVTVDGLPELHDTRRVLVGGQGTWERVVRNTRLALDLGLPVSLRINVDRRNAPSLPTLIDRLIDEQILPRALVTLGFIVDSTDTCAHVKDDVLSDEDRARLTIWFDAELLRRDLLPTAGLPSPLCGPMCSVESKLGFVVAPSGLIFKCWNQIDRGPEEAIGHVSEVPVPNAEAETVRWRRYDPSTRQGCSNCKALPTCMGGCPWEYERLQRVHRGECDTFRFFPKEVVQLAHVRMRARGETRPEVARVR
jgi:uncharacterized protein